MDILAANGHGENLGLQTFSATRCAWNGGEIFLVFFALGIARRVFIAAHDGFAGAFPIDAPARFAAVDGHVVDENLFVLKAVQQHIARFLLQIFPRSSGVFAHMLAHRAKHLGVIIARCKRRNAALVQRQRRVGNEQTRVDLLAAAEARAIGAGAVGRIEAEVARLQLVYRMAVLGTREGKRIEVVARHNRREARSRFLPIGFLGFLIDQMAHHAAIGKLRRRFNRFGNAARRRRLQHHAVDHDVDRVLELFIELDRLAFQALHHAVDAHAREAFFLQVGKDFRVLALASNHDGRQNERLLTLAERKNLVGYLVGGARLDFAPAFRTMRRAHAREQKAQVVVDFRRGAHR